MELKTPTKRHARRTLARSFASPLLDPRLASHRLPTLARGAEASRAHPPRMVETQCFLPSPNKHASRQNMDASGEMDRRRARARFLLYSVQDLPQGWASNSNLLALTG